MPEWIHREYNKKQHAKGVTTKKVYRISKIDYREILRLEATEYAQRRMATSMRSLHHPVAAVLDAAKEEQMSWPVEEGISNEALGENKTLEDMMKEAYFVPESIHTDDLFNQLQMKKVHIAIVVEEYGETSGIVTLEDLLEEIVGNIYDEYDPMEEEEIKQLDDQTYRIAGNVLIEDILDQTGIEIPEDEDYDTLGGFIFSQLQEIPSDGSILDLDFDKYSIHVDQIIDKHVESCIITLKEQQEVEESSE